MFYSKEKQRSINNLKKQKTKQKKEDFQIIVLLFISSESCVCSVT